MRYAVSSLELVNLDKICRAIKILAFVVRRLQIALPPSMQLLHCLKVELICRRST
jgi:hypothetical protein